MHVCHILLVQADTREDAFQEVYSELNSGGSMLPEWSDWHNANDPSSENFAGRWTGSYFKTSPDQPVDEVPNSLCYADDKALAEIIISDQLEIRDREVAGLVAGMITDLTDIKVNNYDSSKWDMRIWQTQKFLRMVENEWTPDSYIYDLHASTASLSAFMVRVGIAPEKQWLVPVDFHF
jgi:hypothetical protein